MRGRFRTTQSLATALPVLESAVRLGSFTRAAAELGLTQPTVSRHVQTIEDRLGRPLFVRDHNRVEPTDLARRLAAAAELGLGHIEAVLAEAVAAPPGGVTLASSFTFANLWLMRRFTDLRRALAPVPLVLKMSYWMEDIAEDGADFRLEWTDAPHGDASRIVLLPEIVYPVAEPALALRLGLADATPDALLSAPLVFEEERASHTNWRRWFAAQGIEFAPPADAYRHVGYAFMLQAVREREGVGLGWHHLVAEDVAAGRLVRVGPPLVRTDLFLTLGWRENPTARPVRDSLIEWLRRETEPVRSMPGRSSPCRHRKAVAPPAQL